MRVYFLSANNNMNSAAAVLKPTETLLAPDSLCSSSSRIRLFTSYRPDLLVPLFFLLRQQECDQTKNWQQ